jgi:hypothetical protein
MSTAKNIYCLTFQDGNIPIDTRHVILKSLSNDLARKNINRAIEVGREQLERSDIYIMAYGGIDIYFIKSWTGSAKHAQLKVKFINHL